MGIRGLGFDATKSKRNKFKPGGKVVENNFDLKNFLILSFARVGGSPYKIFNFKSGL
jgi:hypothetical protein